MAAAPVGSEVGLTYDWHGHSGDVPSEGGVLSTSTGRCYRILSARQVGKVRVSPKGPTRRLAIRALVIEPGDVEDGERVYELAWNRRG